MRRNKHRLGDGNLTNTEVTDHIDGILQEQSTPITSSAVRKEIKARTGVDLSLPRVNWWLNNAASNRKGGTPKWGSVGEPHERVKVYAHYDKQRTWGHPSP